MTRLCFVISILFYSTFASGDCKYYDGTKVTTVSEGKSVSLRSPGKSLENMTIQDQGSLSTCSAHTTSTILKSILPNHPDISYTHAAIMGATRGWQENWSGTKNKYISKSTKGDVNFAGNSWVCQNVAGMKNAGGACPKSFSVTENQDLWNSDIQESLLKGLGAYFDNVNLIKNDPKKMEDLKNDLSLAIEMINIKSADLIKQCEDRKNQKFPIYSPIRSLIEDSFRAHIVEPTKCSQAKTDALLKFLSPDSRIDKDRLKIIPSASTLSLFTNMIEGDPLISKDLESFIANPKGDLSDYPDLSGRLDEKINSLMLKILPDEKVTKECPPFKEGQSPFINTEISEISASFIYEARSQKMDPCKDLLHAYELDFILDPTKNPNSCMAPNNVHFILNAIKPLFILKTTINEQLLPTLVNPESRYANQIVKALMPGCLDQANLIQLNNISCEGFLMCDLTGRIKNTFTYSGPSGGCYTKDNAKKMVRTKALMGINQDRAVGVAICTAFFEKPDIKTKFCTRGLADGEEHTKHEVSLTGYRCKNNQIEYEITNSWGNNCPENTSIECQLDDNQDKTGPFWVKEEALIENTIEITSITQKKK